MEDIVVAKECWHINLLMGVHVALLLLVVAFCQKSPVVRQVRKSLAIILPAYLPAIQYWLVTLCLHAATCQVFLSAHNFITITAMGTITTLSVLHLLSGITGGRLCPIILCPPRAPPGHGYGRQECDDGTL